MVKGGYFITFEGIEGVGKSTQIRCASELLTARHNDFLIVTREPGGTTAGECIRNLVLHNEEARIGAMTELLLIFAARAQHIEEVVLPALQQDKIVLCDRFTDATYAYQGAGRKIGPDAVAIIEDLVQSGLRPDLTILLDAPVETGLTRISERDKQDRFETEQITFFESVRKKYLELAEQDKQRIYTVDAAPPVEDVSLAIKEILAEKELL